MYGIVRVCQRIREDVIAKEKAKFWQTCVRGVEGDLAAKFETGMAWLYGRGVEVNVSRGIGLIQEAAEANFIDAICLWADGACRKITLLRRLQIRRFGMKRPLVWAVPKA